MIQICETAHSHSIPLSYKKGSAHKFFFWPTTFQLENGLAPRFRLQNRSGHIFFLQSNWVMHLLFKLHAPLVYVIKSGTYPPNVYKMCLGYMVWFYTSGNNVRRAKGYKQIAHKSLVCLQRFSGLLTERCGNQGLIATQFCNQILLTKGSGNQVLLTKPRSYAPPVCTSGTPCLWYKIGHVPFSVYTMGVG